VTGEEEVARLVDIAVAAVRSRDIEAVATAIRDLSLHDPAEVLADLLELIVVYADGWDPKPFPEVDGFEEAGVSEVVAAARTADLNGLLAVFGRDFGSVLTKLLGAAAVLTPE
jgi:hypothetical protein